MEGGAQAHKRVPTGEIFQPTQPSHDNMKYSEVEKMKYTARVKFLQRNELPRNV